jgi:hypothetical protein
MQVAVPGSAVKRALGAVVGAVVLVAAGSPAAASPDSIRRALGDTVSGVQDVVLAPVWSAPRATYRNFDSVSDSGWLHAVYAAPGYAGLLFLHVSQGALRCAVGALSIPVGLVMLPFEQDVEWNPFRQGQDPLYELEEGYVRVGAESPWASYDSSGEYDND